MRIGFRVAQFRGDAIFQPLRDEVFQTFRLVVNFVPGIIENIVQEALQQTVMAKNFQRPHLARRRQTRRRGASRTSRRAALAPPAFGAYR